MFSLRVLSLKLQSSIVSEYMTQQNVSITNRNEKSDEHEMLRQILDRNSQSQSSSQGSLLKYQGKIVKDFKKKIHNLKQPVVLKWLYRIGIFIFAVLFALSCTVSFIKIVTQLLIIKAKIRKNRKQMQIVKNSALELNKILNICISARILFEVYCGISDSSSELLGERVDYYKEQIEDDLEKLRQVHNSMQNLDFPHSSEHTELLTGPGSVTIWDIGEQLDEGSKSFSTTSFSVGVTTFVARLTTISGIPSATFTAGVSPDTQKSVARLAYYALYNGETQLRKVAQLSTEYYIEEAKKSFNSDKAILYVFSSLGTGCMVLILFFFIPYIMKVQKSILKVFDHISEIPQGEIKKILDMCYVFKDEIEAPVEKLKAIYEKEDFAMTTDEMRKEERERKLRAEKNKSKTEMIKKLHRRKHKGEKEEEEEKLMARHKKSVDDTDESEKNGDDSEKKYLAIIEERKAAEKKKLFSIITNSKRKGYILRLTILLVFFVVFLITDILLLRIYFKDGNDGFDILRLLTSREYTLKTAVLFFRKDLQLHENVHFARTLALHPLGDNGLLISYMRSSFEKEKEFMDVTRYMVDSFPEMEEYVGLLNSNNSCAEYASSVEGFPFPNFIDCMSVFRGFMSKGISLAILRILRAIQNSMLPLSVSGSSAEVDLGKYHSEITAISWLFLVSVDDVAIEYLDEAFSKAIEKFISMDDKSLNKANMQNNVKFSVFAVSLVFILVIIWVNLLNSINADIFRAKGVFNILPTYLLSTNAGLIKDISEASIFT